MGENQRNVSGMIPAPEQAFREILEKLFEGILVLNHDLKPLYINAAGERLMRSSRDVLLGASLLDLYPEIKNSSLERELLLVVKKRKVSEFEWFFQPWNAWFSVRLSPMADDGVYCFFREITEKKLSEAKVQDAEDRFRFVVESSELGFWYCDLPFSDLQWDTATKRHFHLPPDAAVTIDLFYERLHPEDREPTRRAIEHSIQAKTRYDVIYRTVSADGKRLNWIRAIGRTAYSSEGNPVRFDGITIDVTPLKLAEEKLRESHKRKDEFLAVLSHELRNPLAPIRFALESLKMQPDDPTVMRKGLDMMERQLNHMIRLVDDLMDVSRISQGKISLEKKRLELGAIVEISLEATRFLFSGASQTVTVLPSKSELWVDADEVRLSQALINLLTNASKYSPPDTSISIQLERAGDLGRIIVSDHGIGISSEALLGVWEMFSQVKTELGHGQGGLGIGLALVKQLIELHGGTVSATSSGMGLGSTFVIEIPLSSDADVQPRSDGNTHSSTNPQSLRILLVDDNRDAAEGLSDLLTSCGHSTQIATSSAAALGIAFSFNPDVIFLDIGLPELNGYQIARELRSRPSTTHALLIALTGWGSEEDKIKAKKAGFDFHLTKPAKWEEIREILGRYPFSKKQSR